MATSCLGLILCWPSKNTHIFSLYILSYIQCNLKKACFSFIIDTHSHSCICKLNHSVTGYHTLWNNKCRSSCSTVMTNPAFQTAHHYQKSRSCRASLEQVEGGFDPSTNSAWLENISFILPRGDFWRENSRAIAISSVWQSRGIKPVSQGPAYLCPIWKRSVFPYMLYLWNERKWYIQLFLIEIKPTIIIFLVARNIIDCKLIHLLSSVAFISFYQAGPVTL